MDLKKRLGEILEQDISITNKVDYIIRELKPQLTDEEREFVKSQKADVEELEKYSIDDMSYGLSQDLIDVIPDIKKLLSIINKLTRSKQ